jgi:hypothetical protein
MAAAVIGATQRPATEAALSEAPDRPDPMRVAFTTCPTPYDDARELNYSVRDDGVLEVATLANDRDSAPPTDGQRHGS